MSENNRRLLLIILIVTALIGVCIILTGLLVTISPAISQDVEATVGEAFLGGRLCCFFPGGLILIISGLIWFFFGRKKH